MQEIWKHFIQFDALMQADYSIQQLQEICELARQAQDWANDCLAQKLREYALDDSFLGDMHQASHKHLFGQCGDNVYWKICDNILYINGTGPMWDFDSTPVGELSKQGVHPLWCGLEFDNIIIHNGVTKIGKYAFERVHTATIVIPGSVKTIATMAFWDAHIQQLTLPETIDTIEAYIAAGFSRVVDTLIVSANIPVINPYAFFNRDDIVASTIVLTGELPENLMQLYESCLFDYVDYYKIYYPPNWDTTEYSFFEMLVQKLSITNDTFQQKLKNALVPHDKR